jgi:signal transduction histidine kinase
VIRPRHAVRAFVAAEALLAVGYFALPPSVGKAACHTALGVAPVAAVVVGVRLFRPRQPLAWYLLAAGQLLFVTGDTVNNIHTWVLRTGTSSVADPLYLAVYPLQVAGLLLLVRARTPGRDRASLIDAVIVATGVGLLAWVFLIVPYVREPGLALPQRLIAIAYPLGDVLLLAMATRLWRTGSDSQASRLLTVGLLALLAGDTVYGLRELTDGWVAGSPLDLIWLGYYLGLGLAALHPSMRALSEPATPPPPRLSRQRRTLLTAATLMAPATLVIQSLRHEPVNIGVNAVATVVLFTLLTTRMTDLAGEAARQQEREAALARTVAAAQQERQRLAADLHDGPVQELTAMGLQLDRAGQRFAAGDQESADALVEDLREALGKQIADLRRLLADLWPPALDQHGLADALRLHATSFTQQTGIDVDLDVQVEQRPSGTVETTVYRVVQEALTNVAKHAQARHVQVRVAAGRDGVQLLVGDDGGGFDPAEAAGLLAGGHYGLAGMRERVELVGGRLEISSAPQQGTVIRVTLGA